MQITPTQADVLWGLCSLKDVTGETLYISEYIYFVFYDHVFYKDNGGIGVTYIVRWIGFSHIVGGIILY